MTKASSGVPVEQKQWAGAERPRPAGAGWLDRPRAVLARTGRWRVLAGIALSAALAAGAGCSGDRAESKQTPRRPAVPVAVAKVEKRDMALQVQAIGTVEAYSVVSVKAQVGGELLRVHVKEGQDVRKGELLFTIDPRPFEAAVAQAEATLSRDRVQVQQARAVLERDQARVASAQAAVARDEAQSRNAEVQERRYADLFKRELIAQEQYDQLKTNAESLAATVRADQADLKSAEETVSADAAAVRSAEQVVKADEAAVESAKLQLGYTTITAPIDGRAGSLMLHEGNVVRATGTNDSTLLVINQIRPIYVSFTVPQQQLPAIKRYMAKGPLAATAVPAGDPTSVTGVVTFIDNAVDSATGTIRLKATFPNTEARLWPGQFANVTMTLATEPNAVVVPSQAVQNGQQGPYVFVVKPDSTAEVRRVTTARVQGNETVIADGLQPGETVVTDGQPRLVQGAKVEISTGERGGAGREAPARPRPAGAPGEKAPAATEKGRAEGGRSPAQ